LLALGIHGGVRVDFADVRTGRIAQHGLDAQHALLRVSKRMAHRLGSNDNLLAHERNTGGDLTETAFVSDHVWQGTNLPANSNIELDWLVIHTEREREKKRAMKQQSQTFGTATQTFDCPNRKPTITSFTAAMILSTPRQSITWRLLIGCCENHIKKHNRQKNNLT
jgi:hypothetical protein